MAKNGHSEFLPIFLGKIVQKNMEWPKMTKGRVGWWCGVQGGRVGYVSAGGVGSGADDGWYWGRRVVAG